MKNWLKDNWFKGGIILALFIAVFTTIYYFIVFLPGLESGRTNTKQEVKAGQLIKEEQFAENTQTEATQLKASQQIKEEQLQDQKKNKEILDSAKDEMQKSIDAAYLLIGDAENDIGNLQDWLSSAYGMERNAYTQLLAPMITATEVHIADVERIIEAYRNLIKIRKNIISAINNGDIDAVKKYDTQLSIAIEEMVNLQSLVDSEHKNLITMKLNLLKEINR